LLWSRRAPGAQVTARLPAVLRSVAGRPSSRTRSVTATSSSLARRVPGRRTLKPVGVAAKPLPYVAPRARRTSRHRSRAAAHDGRRVLA
jgi:hypothetical protein